MSQFMLMFTKLSHLRTVCDLSIWLNGTSGHLILRSNTLCIAYCRFIIVSGFLLIICLIFSSCSCCSGEYFVTVASLVMKKAYCHHISSFIFNFNLKKYTTSWQYSLLHWCLWPYDHPFCPRCASSKNS
jgi:hypothetical protein